MIKSIEGQMKVSIIIALCVFALVSFTIATVMALWRAKKYCNENNLNFKKFWIDILLLRNRVGENENYKRLYEKDNELNE